MNERQVEGLCLQASVLGEQDRLLTLLSAEEGLVRIAARYIRTVNRNACLILAGSFGGTET
ncbi:MAG: hypothetical protein EB123_05310, partial [Synechococcaceae bacterium WBB_32_011]|nr:hypothetical protein [Synechococcaceae bacterium WBB_32_011]